MRIWFITFQDLPDYPHQYYFPAEKDGYAGVALLAKCKPLKVDLGLGTSEAKEHDAEGRLITAEFEKFFLVTTYVPNAGRGLVTLPKRYAQLHKISTFVQKIGSPKSSIFI